MNELTTSATIHTTDHQFRLSVPVLRIVPATEAAFFFARRWAFPLLEWFRREGHGFLNRHVRRGRRGKGITLRAFGVLRRVQVVIRRIGRRWVGCLTRE